MKTTEIFPLTGGINRSVTTTRADKSSVFEMMNFRQNMYELGRVEQTPRFYQQAQFPQGSYWDGSFVQTEPIMSEVRLAIDGFYMTQYVFNSDSYQINSFYQTTTAVGETITKGCRIVINSVFGLNLGLGHTLDIEIDSATTFKWRKAGGVWTSGVAITTTGVSIDSGNVTVYFLTDTGFTVTDSWSWIRTDRSRGTTAVERAFGSQVGVFYRNSYYFTAMDDRVMAAKLDASNRKYVISVGYRPIYGVALCFFYDHLIIGGFSTTAVPYITNPRGKTIGWSDNLDIENFIPTDVNEADSYILPNNIQFDTLSNTTTGSFITGVVVIKEMLYIITSYEFYRTSYHGLPIVFNFSLLAYKSTSKAVCVVTANDGAYVLTADDLVFFDGALFYSRGTNILAKLRDERFDDYMPTTYSSHIHYIPQTQELVLANYANTNLLVFQEKYNTWYARAASFWSNRISCVGVRVDSSILNRPILLLGITNRTLLAEDINWVKTPIYDSVSGTQFEPPTITFHAIGQDMSIVKETSSAYVAAKVSTTPNVSKYSIGSNVHVNVNWASLNDGDLTSKSTFSTHTNAYWSPAKVDGRVSFPRNSFRALAFKLTLSGHYESLPPGLTFIFGFFAEIYDSTRKETER